MGMDVGIDVAVRGYFPKGGGVVHVNTRPAQHLRAVVLKEQGAVSTIKVRAYVAGKDRKKHDLPIEWAEAMAKEACDKLAQEFPDAAIEAESVRDASASNGMGTGIFIKATTYAAHCARPWAWQLSPARRLPLLRQTRACLCVLWLARAERQGASWGALPSAAPRRTAR